ncbi:ComF family protein [Janthinobacterium fluminis]|uniref:Double zinc ribbon domain-containing protein n=1 Tax=Janthinobacterium fluminis TaxID=2987524 RepID=A0ABT5K461_9BURK|nr:double zinc ribbon domain-containing protein [Janthinobacterium fluminis]MDC8759781.1 double zinc ribbon domain-containing protein [Janthinobacterium fluminis]
MRERAPARWRALGPALLGALLPAACALCGARGAAMLCAPCRDQYLGRRTPRCPQCANRLPDGAAGLCGRCLRAPPAFDATLVAADYAAPVDQLLLQLKFGARLGLAPLLARLLRDAVLERPDFALPALLCPVPLGPRRLAERGFNQALEIARPLARALGVALHPALAARVRETRAQTRVAPHERGRNLEGAFALTADAAALLRGRHVGVVDDVVTSGQTLGELAATFKRHGAARVSNLVFARTPPR